MIVGDPPDDVTREFRFPEPLGTQGQRFAMKVGIRESKHRLEASPEGQRTRDMGVKIVRKEARADEIPPAVAACIWIEMGARDEALAPLRYLVDSRDPIDETFRTRMRPSFVQDAKCHERDSCHGAFSSR